MCSYCSSFDSLSTSRSNYLRFVYKNGHLLSRYRLAAGSPPLLLSVSRVSELRIQCDVLSRTLLGRLRPLPPPPRRMRQRQWFGGSGAEEGGTWRPRARIASLSPCLHPLASRITMNARRVYSTNAILLLFSLMMKFSLLQEKCDTICMIHDLVETS